MVGKTPPSTAQAERKAGQARGAEEARDDEKTRTGLVKDGEKTKESRGGGGTAQAFRYSKERISPCGAY